MYYLNVCKSPLRASSHYVVALSFRVSRGMIAAAVCSFPKGPELGAINSLVCSGLAGPHETVCLSDTGL